MELFNVQEFDYEKRKRNLTNQASGVVTSTKYFPVFEEESKEKIFKPLSKTKPFSTPLFSYSEVYWSYLINKYIDEETPIYSLAYCYNLSKNQPKYYEKGCIVANILKNDEELVNILELFRKYPDLSVDIDDYINYCEIQYDYTQILTSDFFTINKSLAEKLSEQILCSILRRDQNYHYENVSIIFKDNKPIRVAPIIDLEFSQMFMYPDTEDYHDQKFSSYDEGMEPLFNYDNHKSYEENLEDFFSKIENGSIYDYFDTYKNNFVLKNIKAIVSLYPDVAKDFVRKINIMRKEIETLDINFDSNFLEEFSSYDWRPTRMFFKENKKETDEEYIKAKEEAEARKITLNTDNFNKKLKTEVVWNIDKMTKVINMLLAVNQNKLPNIKEYQNQTLYEKVERFPEEVMQIIKNSLEETNSKQKKK